MTDKYQDRRTAKDAAYAGPDNPYPEGSRLHRYFIKARHYVEDMDARFKDLKQVYGPMGVRRSDRPGLTE